LIKFIALDLDDTLFNASLLVEKSREASLRMMIDYGLPIDLKDAKILLDQIVEEFGSNSESHFDLLMLRLQRHPKYKILFQKYPKQGHSLFFE